MLIILCQVRGPGTIDNFADVHDHKGKMTDDKSLYLEYSGLTPDGKAYVEKPALTIISGTELVMTGEAIVEGKSEYTFNISEKKVK